MTQDSISADEYRAMMAKEGRKGNKYQAIRTEVNGIRFDSKSEANRYGELQLMARTGEIEGLVLQPRFDLHVAGVKIGTYVADFTYFDNRTQAKIVEDVKSKPTATKIYKWKKKHMVAEYGVEIQEVS